MFFLKSDTFYDDSDLFSFLGAQSSMAHIQAINIIVCSDIPPLNALVKVAQQHSSSFVMDLHIRLNELQWPDTGLLAESYVTSRVLLKPAYVFTTWALFGNKLGSINNEFLNVLVFYNTSPIGGFKVAPRIVVRTMCRDSLSNYYVKVSREICAPPFFEQHVHTTPVIWLFVSKDPYALLKRMLARDEEAQAALHLSSTEPEQVLCALRGVLKSAAAARTILAVCSLAVEVSACPDGAAATEIINARAMCRAGKIAQQELIFLGDNFRYTELVSTHAMISAPAAHSVPLVPPPYFPRPLIWFKSTAGPTDPRLGGHVLKQWTENEDKTVFSF